jgi:hypothetical protein
MTSDYQAEQDRIAAEVAAALAHTPGVLVGGPGVQEAQQWQSPAEPTSIASGSASRRRSSRRHDRPASTTPNETPTPTAERTIVRSPLGQLSVDPSTGKALWPPQPELPALGEGPEQVYVEPPADFAPWSLAARVAAEGWRPPLPAVDECLRQREALRMACRRVSARRNGDLSRIGAAVNHAADLLATDPAAEIVAAIDAVALDGWAQSIGSNDSIINSISWQLETNWNALCFRNQRAILRSLIGRDSPAANAFRARIEAMDGMLTPPSISVNDYVIRL